MPIFDPMGAPYRSSSILSERYAPRAMAQAPVTGFPDNAGARLSRANNTRSFAPQPAPQAATASLFGTLRPHVAERLQVDRTLTTARFGEFSDSRGAIKGNPVFEVLTESKVEPALHATVTGGKVKAEAEQQIAQAEAAAVPVPAAGWMFLTGAAAILARRRRKAA